MENQLVKVINESGLDKTKAQVLLENFSKYFEIAADWENKAKSLVVNDISQVAEMKMAREGRLFLKEKRVAVEKTRKQLKENSLREGQTIDAIAKILTNLILPIEEDLEAKEKFKELKEAQELAEITAKRIELLIPFNVAVDSKFIGFMPEENFAAYLTGLQVEKERKEEAERKAEEERIAKEKAEAEERERIRLENERLKKEAEEKEKALEAERKKQAEILAAQKAEAEKKAIEEAAKQAKIQAELKAKADAEKKALEEKARKEREAAEAKLKAEREEKLRIQAELEAKRKAEAEIEAKRIADEKAKKEAEEKAAKAPDKEKLKAWVQSFNINEAPATSVIFDPAKNTIEDKFNAFKAWATSQIENI